MRVVVTGSQRWPVQGVADALRPAFEVATALPAAAVRTAGDVLVVVDASAREAADIVLQAAPTLPILWLVDGASPALPARNAPQGLLGLNADAPRLVAAIHAVAAGLHVFDDPAALPGSGAASAELSEPLTQRELQVFELMAKGLANREIGLALGVSSHTAKFHVAQILAKTGAATRTEAVRQGLRLGLIGL